MAQIGTFTRDESGVFSGAIRTLTLSAKATIRSVESDNDKAPDHRVYASAKVEIGAGWTKTARESGTEYLSLKLDDPSLPSPISAQPVQGDGDEWKLIWSRRPAQLRRGVDTRTRLATHPPGTTRSRS